MTDPIAPPIPGQIKLPIKHPMADATLLPITPVMLATALVVIRLINSSSDMLPLAYLK
jgi:hypothetical protein